MRLKGLGGGQPPSPDPEAQEETSLRGEGLEATIDHKGRPSGGRSGGRGRVKEDDMATRYIDRTIDGNAQIKVVGVGGAGGNAVNRMISSKLRGVEFVAVNTDLQALANSQAHHKLNIGKKLTRGLGSGGDPRKGQEAAEESRQELSDLLKDCDMVFITAGEGGGTGTGAAPVVAEIARQSGALTIGVVTKPFVFEGVRRKQVADEGIVSLRE